MKSVRLLVIPAALFCAVLAVAQDQKPASSHVMVEGAQVSWGPARRRPSSTKGLRSPCFPAILERRDPS
jgi:hypothetical protein